MWTPTLDEYVMRVLLRRYVAAAFVCATLGGCSLVANVPELFRYDEPTDGARTRLRIVGDDGNTVIYPGTTCDRVNVPGFGRAARALVFGGQDLGMPRLSDTPSIHWNWLCVQGNRWWLASRRALSPIRPALRRRRAIARYVQRLSATAPLASPRVASCRNQALITRRIWTSVLDAAAWMCMR